MLLCRRQTCQSKGGDLAIIRSAQENDFILDLLMKQTTVNENGTWIGLQKDDAGSLFYWTDGTPLAGQYQNWDTRKPDNAGGQEKCGNMWAQVRWVRRGSGMILLVKIPVLLLLFVRSRPSRKSLNLACVLNYSGLDKRGYVKGTDWFLLIWQLINSSFL